MKLAFVAAFKAFARRHVLKLAVAGVLLLATAAALAGWRHYQYRQTADFAFQRFREALRPVNLEALVAAVDFNGLCRPLARAMVRHYPFLRPGPLQEQHLDDMVQERLLEQLRVKKEESPKELPDEASRLKSPLYVVPPDLITQFLTSLALERADAATAVLTATVRHQLLDRDFPLRLRMERTAGGWRVSALENAEELVGQFREAQLARMRGQRQLLVDKNAATQERMDSLAPVEACHVQSGLLSDGKTRLAVVTVQARNKGQAPISSMNFSATIQGAGGEPLLQRYLNAVDPVMPGQPFSHSWTIEMEAGSRQGRALDGAGLTCQARWQTMGLGTGEVLHLMDILEPIEEFQ